MDAADDEATRRGEVTLLLAGLRAGESGAQDRLFAIVYAELRRRAGALMSGQRAGHTLQPTALVHEAYLRLVGSGECSYEDRGHFFGSASRAMRSILVDHARAKLAAKRTHGSRVALVADAVAAREPPEEIVAVHEALERLEAIDPLKSQIVEMHYFGALEFAEIARVLGLPERTMYRHWDRARAWLRREMTA